jgi:hypothetical protein
MKPTAVALLAVLPIAMTCGGCGGQSTAAPSATQRQSGRSAAAVSPAVATVSAAPAAATTHLPAWPIVANHIRPERTFAPVASIRGQTAAWIARRSGVTLVRFDQRLAHLALHAGSVEPGGGGWAYGDRIGPREVHRVLAGFNGGFRLSYGSVGFMANGHTAVPLARGLGSVVTYADGGTEIGAWRAGVPARGRRIASVLQNLHLLVDRGVAAPTVNDCIRTCWGRTIGGKPEVARSALGITRDSQLVWAAGESLSPARIARALIAAGAVRAVQLDINPYWIDGYLYVHHRTGPTPVRLVPGQHDIPGQLLTPDSRDFFTVVAN